MGPQGLDLLRLHHRSDLRRDRCSGETAQHNGRQQRPQFPHHRDRDHLRHAIELPVALQCRGQLQGQNAAHERGDQHHDRDAVHADADHLLGDCRTAQLDSRYDQTARQPDERFTKKRGHRPHAPALLPHRAQPALRGRPRFMNEPARAPTLIRRHGPLAHGPSASSTVARISKNLSIRVTSKTPRTGCTTPVSVIRPPVRFRRL